jgi:hypothetical protein
LLTTTPREEAYMSFLKLTARDVARLVSEGVATP